MLITIVAGARPNFMKIAPIIRAIKVAQSQGKFIDFRLVHTGQHYDSRMSGNFFKELNIPDPNKNLNAGGGTQAEQTGSIMIRFEKELIEHPCDMVLVVGDVTSTMACAIVAQKMKIKVAHIEGGIRSGDWGMPEEINRLVTDSISNFFFTTSEIANENLLKSGITKDRIFYVGNTMIDTLLSNRSNFIKPFLWNSLGLTEKEYFVMTLHRPSNVDEAEKFRDLIDTIINNSGDLPLLFPIHPRTAKLMDELKISHPRLHLVEPLGYLEFNYLVERAIGVITDSGGITEETSILNIPCITLRENTERPETISHGTNCLTGTDSFKIGAALKEILDGNWKNSGTIPLWDGNASTRIIEIILQLQPIIKNLPNV